MGEVLHEVDFNQLKIENKQYLEKIDEKNQELLRLKLMAGNTLQILNHFKVDCSNTDDQNVKTFSQKCHICFRWKCLRATNSDLMSPLCGSELGKD